MSFKQAAILGPVSFFLGMSQQHVRDLFCHLPGIFFICSTIDYRLLWEKVTNDVQVIIINDGFQIYITFLNAPPPAIKVRSMPWASGNCC
jgi:hypothetical protein